MKRGIRRLAVLSIIQVLKSAAGVFSWTSTSPSGISINSIIRQKCSVLNAKAGSFFNQVPGDNSDEFDDNNDGKPKLRPEDFFLRGEDARKGFGKPPASIQKDSASNKPYIGIGPPSANDVTKPEYDKNGYTLYTDEKTGEKSRVFDALVEYPCKFTLKIVGANDGTFVEDMLVIVQSTCEVEDSIDHSVKINGRWTSVTVHAPVANAEMLYQLYENVDRDPRVRFKF